MDSPRDTFRYQMQRTRPDVAAHSRVDWARELNEQQLAAVTAPDGAVLVLAGAGSGKTRVITYRCAYLIEARRIDPHQILLTTFTNKAARSMLDRVEQVAGPLARDVTGGTFHHIANLQLRRYAKLLGYDANFTILDETDAQQVMKLCRNAAGLDHSEQAFPSARLLHGIASTMINTNSDLEALLYKRYSHLIPQRGDIERVLVDYSARKLANNQMDFDDLLVNFYRLLAEQPQVRRELCQRYQHVLVDEYQDVNHLQAAIVRALYSGGEDGGAPQPASGPVLQAGRDEAEAQDSLPPIIGSEEAAAPVAAPGPGRAPDAAPPAYRGLFVVGDDAQSIYSFRGADYHNIRSFPSAFPGAHVYKLEINYRSVPEVLALANQVMNDADPQFAKELRPVKPGNAERPLLLGCQDADEQAEFVAERILSLREEIGLDYRRVAVLYRAHNNRLEVELELTQRGIPFVVRGGLRFFEQAHIKDLLAYLFVLGNSRDELAWQRVMGMCHRVGPKTIAGVMTVLKSAREDEGGLLGKFIMNGAADTAKGAARNSLVELRDFLRTIARDAEHTPPSDLLRSVLDGRYRHYLELQYENWRQRLDDLEQLVVFAQKFDGLQPFLSEVGLNGSFSGGEFTGGPTDDPEEGAVTLSTIHQAKGLEWQVVFLVHCQDEVLPHRMALQDESGVDEERRLLYVAITRAEELLYMSYPMFTETRDYQRLLNKPSRFLADEWTAQHYDRGVLEWSDPG